MKMKCIKKEYRMFKIWSIYWYVVNDTRSLGLLVKARWSYYKIWSFSMLASSLVTPDLHNYRRPRAFYSVLVQQMKVSEQQHTRLDHKFYYNHIKNIHFENIFKRLQALLFYHSETNELIDAFAHCSLNNSFELN